MKTIFEGELLIFNSSIHNDFVEIKHKTTYYLNNREYFIVPQDKSEIQQFMIVNYIKRTRKNGNIGLMGFEEFSEIECYENVCVFSEIYEIKRPFEIMQSFENNHRILKIKNRYGKKITVCSDNGIISEKSGKYLVLGEVKRIFINSENMNYRFFLTI